MSGILSAGELASMQAVVSGAMDISIEIQRSTTSRGPTGNVIDGYAHLSTVTGHLAQPTAGQLANYDYKIANLSAWQVLLPFGTDVAENDHLIVGGQTLLVQTILAPESYQIAVQLLATELT